MTMSLRKTSKSMSLKLYKLQITYIYTHIYTHIIHPYVGLCNMQLIKNFCFVKNLVRMKRRDTDWEKIFVNHMSDKGPVSRICKELSNTTVKEKNKTKHHHQKPLKQSN